ncbi:hypothetical protein BDZ45DRAFT_732193 [Acephala macrosclerotiorum]|nr:hypothetical protein BDZ45DRAFT_732193 [Acephala macrosclerotiorum]
MLETLKRPAKLRLGRLVCPQARSPDFPILHRLHHKTQIRPDKLQEESPTNMPCGLCNDCSELEHPNLPQVRTGNQANLVTAAGKGCKFCKLILEVWNHEENKDWRDVYNIGKSYVHIRGPKNGGTGHMTLEFFPMLSYDKPAAPHQMESVPVIETSRTFVVYNPEEGRIEAWPSLATRVETGVEESIEFVRDAIRECTRHVECPTPAPPPTLPTRLLEIREKAVRLIETVNAPQVVNYAALSYYADKNGKKVEVRIQRLDADKAAWSVAPGFRSSRKTQAPMSTTKPVASRAWVFQENTLSARVIHFTGLEELGVLYECRHGLRAEKIVGSTTIFKGTKDLFKRIRQWNKTLESYTRDLQPWKRWRDLVRDYFPLRLTRECDRLPALSGLADSFARKLPEPKPRYLAGLWKPSLAPDLCWTRELCWRTLRTEGFVSGEYVAPSWSWASVQGDGMAFGADSTSFKPLITSFQDTVVPKSGKNVYGSVSNGSSITMTVPRAELKLTCLVTKDGERTYALSSVIIDAQELWVIPDTVLESWEIPPTN